MLILAMISSVALASAAVDDNAANHQGIMTPIFETAGAQHTTTPPNPAMIGEESYAFYKRGENTPMAEGGTQATDTQDPLSKVGYAEPPVNTQDSVTGYFPDGTPDNAAVMMEENATQGFEVIAGNDTIPGDKVLDIHVYDAGAFPSKDGQAVAVIVQEP